MHCNDCGNKVNSYQEYCNRCGAELYKKQNRNNPKVNPVFHKLFGNDYTQ